MPLGKSKFENRFAIFNSRQIGAAYLFVLLAIAIVSLGLSAVGTLWSEGVRRDRENDLLKIGAMYANAIGAYYEAAPGNQRRYPSSLNDLLEDKRFVGVKRHLRQLYSDPVSGSVEWGSIRNTDGGIQGVYSLSDRQPIKQVELKLNRVVLPIAKSYQEWKFVAQLNRQTNY